VFESRRGLRIFLYDTASRPALGPTQPHIQRIPGNLSLGVNRPRSEADHSPPSSAEVKECVEMYLHSTQYAFIAFCLVKLREDFTFTLQGIINIVLKYSITFTSRWDVNVPYATIPLRRSFHRNTAHCSIFISFQLIPLYQTASSELRHINPVYKSYIRL
jgi:hypothetical protein